jgi:hypothetical protein
MNLYEKQLEAIRIIKKKDLKKAGHNDFSKYDYYTPEQVNQLVTNACLEVKTLPKFDLIRNELGIVGRLQIFDVENMETQPLVYEMASDIPNIKATNVSQQLGGAMTYTKRYLYMDAFEIADNSLDFDTTENTVKNNGKKTTEKPIFPADKFNDTVKWLKNGGKLTKLKDTYFVDEQTEFNLITASES